MFFYVCVVLCCVAVAVVAIRDKDGYLFLSLVSSTVLPYVPSV